MTGPLRALGSLARSLMQALLVLLALFALFGSLSGDAVDVLALRGDLDAAQMQALRAEYGLDRPVVLRFADWLVAGLQGELGVSQRFQQPVAEMLLPALATTLRLALLSGGLGIGLALLLVLGVALQSRLAAVLVNGLNIWSIALPTFCLGLAALLLFSVHLRWLPAIGSLVAPVLILGLDNAGQVAKPLAEEVLELVHRPHVVAARARGLSPLAIAWWHVLPLAAPVGVAMFGIVLAGLLAGTLTMEVLFGLPGIGALVLQGIQGRDEPVVLAGLSVIALAIMAVNGMAAMAQAVLDPRG